MNYQQVDNNLFLISLDQKLEGFRDFISSWLYMDDSITFLVDPGPLYSIDILKATLDGLGVERLDYILLSHIHIDHAGGVGKLIKYFPDVKVLCHPKGIEHMIDPSRLWKGSLDVLGDIARAYGEIQPIPGENIFYEERIEFNGKAIEIIDTPGHAAHHFSFIFGDILFAGEVAGVYVPIPDRLYIRAATPPQFRLDIWLESLDRVSSRKSEILCYGHYGFRRDVPQALNYAGEQLSLWTDVIEEELAGGGDKLHERIIESLKVRDKVFANYEYLDADIKKREDHFIRNSINGIREYVEWKNRKEI